MKKKNFVGYRDRILIHLLQFEKEVHENIHNNIVDNPSLDFLIYLTQEGIAQGVGTKQSTVYKELQVLRKPAHGAEEALIDLVEKVRIPGKERASAIYFLTPYGLDISTQKKVYLEHKNLEVYGWTNESSEIISIKQLMERILKEGLEQNQIKALLRIASIVSGEGVISWNDLSRGIVEDPVKSEVMEKRSYQQITIQEKGNPYFNRTAIKEPDYFIGREEEVHYILSLLSNTQSCSIVGPRRIGKSSLINYISNPDILKAYGLNPDEYIVVSIDLEGMEDLTQSEFFGIFLEEIRNRTADENLRDRIGDLLEKDNIRFLDLKNIFREISDLNLKTIFLFDEFELITNNQNLDSNFFSGLRNLANTYNVGYITSSNSPLLELTFSRETLGSPFFNFFTQIDLGIMKDKDVELLITGPSRKSGIDFPEKIVDRIKRTAGPHPMFLQMLCFHFFKWQSEHGSITDEEISVITKIFQNEAKQHFQYFWDRLDTEEQNILKELQQENKIDEGPNRVELITKLRKKALLYDSPVGTRIISESFANFVEQADTVRTSGPFMSKGLEDSVIEIKKDSKLQVVQGNNYFVYEDSLDVSVRFYIELTKRNFSGLFISRIPINSIEEQWGGHNSKIMWLCKAEGEDHVQPTLMKIYHTIFDFIKKNKNCVILFEGLEFVINNNDFSKTLKLMDNIKEIVAMNKAIYIFPMNTKIYSEKEKALLCKNSIEFSKEVDFDFSKLKI